MAIIRSVAVGAAKGKVGNLVYSRNAGRTIAREYQPSVKNPRTPEQLAQRSKMKEVVVLYDALRDVLKGSFAGRKRTLSVFNAFVSANVGAMSGTTDGKFSSIYNERPELKIANGNLGKITVVGNTVDFGYIKHKLRVGDKLTAFVIGNMGDAGSVMGLEKVTLTDELIQSGEYQIQTAFGSLVGAFITTKDGRKSTESIILWV
jgi:hypothetical protein